MFSHLRTRLNTVLQYLTSSAWFAYGSLALLQLKVVFGMWFYRDMPAGDTASYFTYAALWHDGFRTNIVWSPLYTTFWGTLMNFTDSVYTVTIAHRLILVFVVSLLVLALMRRLLPHSIAWLIGAWWVVAPVNFDLLYEVHLFAVIPVLIACLVALHRPNLWTRGAVLGIFLISAALDRNELFLATGLWALACLVWEIHQARKREAFRPLVYIRAYGIPVLLSCFVVLFFYSRSVIQMPYLSPSLEQKHTLNVCQIYAFSYRQRYTDWTESPWTQCQDLMLRDFGVPQPSLLEAIGRNPRAMLGYFLWNGRLIPDGLQVLLFNATAGTGQPDFIPKTTGAAYPLVLSILGITILIVGLWLLRRHRQWDGWLSDRVWGWVALLCVIIVTFLVMFIERPRPEYMLMVFYFLTAVVGMCAFAIVDRWVGIKRFALLPIIAIALIVAVPTYFTPDYHNPDTSVGRPVDLRYMRLLPYRELLSEPGTTLLTNGWAVDLCYYITDGACQPIDYRSLVAQKPGGVSLADWVAQQKVTVFYVDESIFADPAAQSFLKDPQSAGWDTIAWAQTNDTHWELLKRRVSS